jgi:hypothetical protein
MLRRVPLLRTRATRHNSPGDGIHNKSWFSKIFGELSLYRSECFDVINPAFDQEIQGENTAIYIRLDCESNANPDLKKAKRWNRKHRYRSTQCHSLHHLCNRNVKVSARATAAWRTYSPSWNGDLTRNRINSASQHKGHVAESQYLLGNARDYMMILVTLWSM